MNAAGGVARAPGQRLRGIVAQIALVLVAGGVYVQSLLPGPGHSHDTAEVEFSAHLLCVTHPTGYPTRCLGPDTPYLAHSVTNLAQLWGYATGDRRPDGATALFP